MKILLFVLLHIALLTSGQENDSYAGGRAYLELYQRSGIELNPVQVNRNGEHCLQGCINGDCSAEHGSFQCICRKNWFGVDCSQHICDRLGSELCNSVGTCMPDGDDYFCLCPAGSTGEFCNFTCAAPGSCGPDSCFNGGTCYNNLTGGYNCICPPGYYGPRCEEDFDRCAGELVEHCYGNVFPNCSCFGEWDERTKCSLLGTYSVCDFESPCRNGQCHHISHFTYSCECPPNATGLNCSETYDPCDPNPCANGGICQPAYGGHYFQCNCPVGYGGLTCEGVYLELNDVIYPNNSVALLSHIGGDVSALHCYGNLQGCCGTPGMRHGEFYFPNGTAVPIEGEKFDIYRNRGDQFIRLNRRILATDTATFAGKYRCEIPDEWGNTRNLYITLK